MYNRCVILFIRMTDKRRKPRPAIINGDTAYIPLGIGGKDGYALVDSDMAWLADEHKWTLDGTRNYAVTGTYIHDGKRLPLAYMHRIVAGLENTRVVKHISRDKLDNRRFNLRVSGIVNKNNEPNTISWWSKNK